MSKENPTSPLWKRPEDVMKLHRLKMKKRALQARMSGRSFCNFIDSENSMNSDSSAVMQKSEKRKNPFSCGSETQHSAKRFCEDYDSLNSDMETSCDNSLFQLLNTTTQYSQSTSSSNLQTSFSSILSKMQKTSLEGDVGELKAAGKRYIPIDWSLKTKMRFLSEKPFPWSQKLRTCEEASGTSGFVRCINSEQVESQHQLDTSASAQFHQCCLVWMHPSLPWLQLFPRTSGRISSTATSVFAVDSKMRESLHREWGESLRSLFQLVRACQCPYFYVCANNFTCLFRAAGIGGYSNTHVFVAPTTRGFRQMLKEEDVIFTLPLKKNLVNKRLSSEGLSSDMGYETQDSVSDDADSAIKSQKTDVVKENEEGDDDEEDDDEEDDDDEDDDDWLRSMGMAKEEIKKLNSKQVKIKHNKEREVDSTPESLIYAEGVEAQAFFNFLMNCKSAVAASGPLTGVPPTLLAPVAFQGGTLKPLQVRHSMVKVDNSAYHSVELRGPILPHAIHDLCALIQKSQEEFSATFALMESTRAFTLAAQSQHNCAPDEEDLKHSTTDASPSKSCGLSLPVTPTKTPSAFGKENLSDCGLRPSVLKSFCRSEPDRVEPVEGLKYCSDGTFTCS